MKKRDIIIILSIILICVALIFMNNSTSSDGNTAIVTVDGKIIYKLPLDKYSSDNPTDISLEDYGVNIILRLQNSHIQFLSSDCPDKVCINSGILQKENDMAVCLPNKTSVVIYNNKEADKLN